MPAEFHVTSEANSATSAAAPQRDWLPPLARIIRYASIVGLLALNLRFVVLEIGWATRAEIIAFVLTLAVILPASLSRPVLGPLLSLPLVVVLSILHPLQIFFSPQALLFPFVAATLIWFFVRLARSPEVLGAVTPYGWLADCFGLALLAKVILSLASPSLVNGLWAAALIPQDIWMAEFQALNVGFLLANGLLAFQILTVELRGKQKLFQALLAIEFGLVACAAFAQLLSGWPEGNDGAITAPFFGVHELGAFTAAFFGVSFGFTMAKKTSRWWRWKNIVILILVTVLVLVSHSKSAWFAVIIILGFGIIYRLRFIGAGALLVCLTAGLLILRNEPGIVSGEVDSLAERARNFLHPEQWHEQSNNKDRLSLYQKAWVLIKERPLDGVGVGDFRISESQESRQITGQMWRSRQNLHDAHNFFLNFASEMGLPSALLFLAIVAVPLFICTRGIMRGDADGWMLASLLAIFGFFFVNLFNCVITWPYQALFMGQFLAMPFASKDFAASASAASVPGWGLAKWKFWAPLLPVLLILAAAPFSIADDRRIQSRSAGNFHWLWWHDGLEFSILPEVIFQIMPEDNIRAIEIIPINNRPSKEEAKIRVFVDGKEVYLGKLPNAQPLMIPLSPTFENGFSEVRVLTPAPWEIWRFPSQVGLVEAARIRLIGDDGPVDARELALEQ